jgi:hypothetical protein
MKEERGKQGREKWEKRKEKRKTGRGGGRVC